MKRDAVTQTLFLDEAMKVHQNRTLNDHVQCKAHRAQFYSHLKTNQAAYSGLLWPGRWKNLYAIQLKVGVLFEAFSYLELIGHQAQRSCNKLLVLAILSSSDFFMHSLLRSPPILTQFIRKAIKGFCH